MVPKHLIAPVWYRVGLEISQPYHNSPDTVNQNRTGTELVQNRYKTGTDRYKTGTTRHQYMFGTRFGQPVDLLFSACLKKVQFRYNSGSIVVLHNVVWWRTHHQPSPNLNHVQTLYNSGTIPVQFRSATLSGTDLILTVAISDHVFLETGH